MKNLKTNQPRADPGTPKIRLDKIEEPEPKKAKITLNKIDIFLALVLALVIAFIIAMIWLFTQYMMIPDSLVAGVFALAGGECGILGWIKHSKERAKDREWQLEDREYNKANGKKEDNSQCVG